MISRETKIPKANPSYTLTIIRKSELGIKGNIFGNRFDHLFYGKKIFIII